MSRSLLFPKYSILAFFTVMFTRHHEFIHYFAFVIGHSLSAVFQLVQARPPLNHPVKGKLT